MLTLVVQDREGKSISQYPLVAKPEVVLGRATDVDIPLLSKNVSRRHAKIRHQGQQFLIEDLGSANGVILNGTRIQGPTEIQGGAEIRIGDFTIVVATQGEEQESTGQKPAASLLGQNGPFQGKVMWLKPGDNVVGRGSESDVVVVDGSISRKHAILTLGGTDLVVRDLGSSNGTFLGEQKLNSPTRLQSGAVVRFGSLSFLFSATSSPSAAANQTETPNAASFNQPSSAPSVPVPSAPLPQVPAPKAAVPSSPISSEPAPEAWPKTASAPVNWLGVIALLLTPLSLLLVLGVGLFRLLGPSPDGGGSLSELRAAAATSAKTLSEAEEKRTQGDWLEAEDLLQKILDQNPGDPKARALYTEVHFQAENLRHLRQAQTLLTAKKYQEASEEARKVEEESEFAYEADLLEEEANRRKLAGLLLKGAAACEKGQYQDCLGALCAYLSEESKDPEAYFLAQIALGKIPPPPPESPACINPPQKTTPADPRGMVEKLYEDVPPLQNAALLFFDGDSTAAKEAAREALLVPENADIKPRLEKALETLSDANDAVNELDQKLAQEKLYEAERAARTIWQAERALFSNKRVEGVLGMNTRRKLIDAFVKKALSLDLTKPEEWRGAKKLLDYLARFDQENSDVFRYAAEARLNAALREAYEVALLAAMQEKTEVAQKSLQAMLPLLPKGTAFRARVEKKLMALSGPPPGQ